MYSGRPLSCWVLGHRRAYNPLSSYRDLDLDAGGKAAVRAAGTNAIPYLLKWLEGRDGWWAARAFGGLGPAGQPAIPDLERMATNPAVEHPQFAVFALGQIGPASLPALSAIATNGGSAYLRCVAVMQLAEMGTNARPAVPAFTQCLKDDDPAVVRGALAALRDLRVSDPAVFEAERGILSNTNARVRYAALLSLAVFGDRAVPDLVHSLEDGPISGLALEVLVRIAPEALTNAAVIREAAAGMGSPDRERRKGAAQVLCAAGQWVQGGKVDLGFPVPGGWDRVFADATNALLRLAPELLDQPKSKGAP